MRALTEHGRHPGPVDEHGIAYPDPLTTNIAKYTFATSYHQALELVQDCAGGLLVTGPGGEDWAQPRGAAGAREVLRAEGAGRGAAAADATLISDLTARDFGGYHAVLAVHAEGSIEAEKMQIFRAYEPGRAVAYARRLGHRVDRTRQSATPERDRLRRSRSLDGASEGGKTCQATRGARGSTGVPSPLG